MSAPLRVLVVDDDDDLREVMALSLAAEGIEVSTAADGLDALERLRSGPPPSVILLDLRMPRMNGFELLAALKRDRALAAIPVVVITGDGRDSDAALEAGALASCKKPISADELVAVTRHFAAAAPDGRPT